MEYIFKSIFKRSFPKILIIKLKGVKIKKYIKGNTGQFYLVILTAITVGKYLSNSCFKNANIKKINDIDKAQNLIVLPSNKGQVAIKKKTIENKIPKLFSEDLFMNYFL